MSILTSAAVLDLWEAGLPMAPAARAVLLLQATGESDLAAWSIGRRDQTLLTRFCPNGSLLESVVDCPTCGVALEVTFDPLALVGGPIQDQVRVTSDGYLVLARPPTVGDLAALPSAAAVAELRETLLARCVIAAEHDGAGVGVTDLPEAVVVSIEDALDNADPAADIRVALTCHDCGTEWSESLDPVVFAWSAVENAARGLAADVATLAGAYGWSEPEILALSPFRRHLYLSAVAP